VVDLLPLGGRVGVDRVQRIVNDDHIGTAARSRFLPRPET
jgi:hypothetical protein